jgi:Tfp pilus assembly PilM family ATPase
MAFSLRPLKKIFRLIKPRVEIGGLDISDGGVLFVSVDPETKKLKQFSIRLPEGIIVNGKIQNPSELAKALKQLHQQITIDRTRKIPVVISMSDTNIYSQQFELPPLQSTNLDEAVRLNLQVLSPIDFSKAYSDWQKVENPKTRGVEILASFVEKDVVDKIIAPVTEENFVPVAIEQKAASLTRIILQSVSGNDSKIPYFLMYVSSDGLGFSIIRQGHLYFNRFTPWSGLTKGKQRQISLKEFSETIIQESHRIMNFYASHFNENISYLYVVAPGMENQVKQIVEENFAFKIEPLVLKDYPIDQSWLVALGAAVRGLIPRSIDTEISLSPEGTESQFFHSQIITFAQMWRSIIISVCATILVACVGVFLFLGSVINDTAQDFNKVAGGYNVTYLNALKQQAQAFNQLVDKATAARKQQTRWTKALNDIYSQAGPNVTIDRFYVQSLDFPAIINGHATDANSAVDFKNKLASLPYLSGVDLPLSSLNPGTASNEVVFTISFKIGDLPF